MRRARYTLPYKYRTVYTYADQYPKTKLPPRRGVKYLANFTRVRCYDANRWYYKTFTIIKEMVWIQGTFTHEWHRLTKTVT